MSLVSFSWQPLLELYSSNLLVNNLAGLWLYRKLLDTYYSHLFSAGFLLGVDCSSASSSSRSVAFLFAARMLFRTIKYTKIMGMILKLFVVLTCSLFWGLTWCRWTARSPYTSFQFEYRLAKSCPDTCHWLPVAARHVNFLPVDCLSIFEVEKDTIKKLILSLVSNPISSRRLCTTLAFVAPFLPPSMDQSFRAQRKLFPFYTFCIVWERLKKENGVWPRSVSGAEGKGSQYGWCDWRPRRRGNPRIRVALARRVLQLHVYVG